MSYLKYCFEQNDLNIECETRWSDSEVRKLAKEIFDAWCAENLRVDSLHNQIRMKGTLYRRTEGRSAAEVYELAFSESHQPSNYSIKFIVRAHFGSDAETLAAREIQLVRQVRN